MPIRIGGGTRLKIYEAMAMEKPIISTTIGAEGLPVGDGTDLLLADTPEAFAGAVVRVLRDAEFAGQLGARAGSIVREKFGWNRVAASFAEICERTVERRARGIEPKGEARIEPKGDADIEPDGEVHIVPGGAARIVPGGAARIEPDGDAVRIEHQGGPEIESEGGVRSAGKLREAGAGASSK